jgi:adenylate cyclase
MRPITLERRVKCTADVCTLWRGVTDTERLNRGAGMKPVALSPLSGATAARYTATTVLGGFTVEFEELPFEWKEFEVFESVRSIRSGPIRLLKTRFEFTPGPESGTVVDVKVSLVPRHPLLRPVIVLAASQSLRAIVRSIQQIDAAQGKATRAPSTARLDAVERARRAMEHQDPEVVERLARFVTDESDAGLSRIRPYELADAWGLERKRVLTACIEAVGAGLFELRWDIICPSCRTASARVPKLIDLPKAGHCQLCDLDFEMNLERAVEATFSPHPSIREIDAGPYCIGGPARTPHVYVQVVAQEGATTPLSVPAQPGRYRLFARGGAVATLEVKAGANDEVFVVAGEAMQPDHVQVSPGGKVLVENKGPERHIKLERLEWLDSAASAHEVSLLGPFRRLFSTDVLSTGTVLRVARVGFLFTDLTASTALYTRAGDASAYKLVHEHFELLDKIIVRHRGAVVKTIGDAVMAAFVDELAGLDACTEMLEAFYRFRHGRALCDEVFLKLGFFAGPSYVVSANQALDYFGQTVNIAARLQAKAESSELVTAADLALRARASGRLGKLVVVEEFEATLKGLLEPVACARLRLAADIARSVRPPGDIARSELADKVH